MEMCKLADSGVGIVPVRLRGVSAGEGSHSLTGAGAGSRTGIGWDWRRDCSWSLGGGDD